MEEITRGEVGATGSTTPANGVSEKFDSGASYLISQERYKYYICEEGGTGLIGRPDGQFVAPINEMDDVLLQADNAPRIMEELSGLEEGSCGDAEEPGSRRSDQPVVDKRSNLAGVMNF